MTSCAILVLAAGSSSRMRGGDKLLEKVDDVALLADRLSMAKATGCAVYVTLPPREAYPDRWTVIPEGVTTIEVLDAATGMAQSLKAGICALPAATDGALVLLADMPDITRADVELLLEQFDGETILRGASAQGTPGHPVVFAARDFMALSQISGDQGAKEVLHAQKARVRLVPLPSDHALTDLDTPEAWAAWRASRGSS